MGPALRPSAARTGRGLTAVLLHNLAIRVAAAALLIILLPWLGIFGLGVLVSLGRPVLFRQQRSGLGGRTFTLVKLRSMREVVDTAGRSLPDAARVSAYGRFLRRSRLDELPGLWNVIRGDMAVIGPRPLLPETIAALGEKGTARGEVRPGLTGWSQVNGNTLLSLEEKVALDLWYVAHASAWLDLRIAVMTIWVMVGGERRVASVARLREG